MQKKLFADCLIRVFMFVIGFYMGSQIVFNPPIIMSLFVVQTFIIVAAFVITRQIVTKEPFDRFQERLQRAESLIKEEGKLRSLSSEEVGLYHSYNRIMYLIATLVVYIFLIPSFAVIPNMALVSLGLLFDLSVVPILLSFSLKDFISFWESF